MHSRSTADILASAKPAPLKRSQKSAKVNPLASDTHFTQFSETTAAQLLHQFHCHGHTKDQTYVACWKAPWIYHLQSYYTNFLWLWLQMYFTYTVVQHCLKYLNVIMKQLCFQHSHNSLGFPGQFGLFLMCHPWENKLWVGNMNSGKCDHICLSHVTWLDCSGEVEINEPFMEVGMGAAQYRDLNTDLPSCISKFHIQDGHEPSFWMLALLRLGGNWLYSPTHFFTPILRHTSMMMALISFLHTLM